MPTFDSLLDHLARAGEMQSSTVGGARNIPPGTGGSDTPATRGTNRIITSERLDRYEPFSMSALASGHEPGFVANELATGLNAELATGANTEADAGSTIRAREQALAPDYATGRKSGLTEGFQRGFEAGAAHARAQYEAKEQAARAAFGDRLASLIGDFEQRMQAIEREAADEVIALAIEIARQAVRATVTLRRETIVPIVQEALASIVEDSVRMHLRLNPADEALVRVELGTRLANMNCEIIADTTIEAGGCRIETPRATVDATMTTRWRRTLAALGQAPTAREASGFDDGAEFGPDDGVGALV